MSRIPRTWAWWRLRLIELSFALIVVYVVIQLAQAVGERQEALLQRQKDLLPASAWFEVHEIYVPDHEVGSNPLLKYDRTIHESFTGFWIVEVQLVRPDGLFTNVCSGDGVNDYDLDEILENDEVTWEWMLDRPCAVPDGQYRLRASYVMTRPDWPEKRVMAYSNVFRVTSPSKIAQ